MSQHSADKMKDKKKRTELDIIRGILEWAINNQGGKQTHMMYKVNLSHPQMKCYMDNLVARGLIDVHGTNHKYVFITKAGINYYINLRISEKLVNMFGEDKE
jgi:predicted transcriptional regulator